MAKSKGRYDKTDEAINSIMNSFENPASGMAQVQACMLYKGHMGSVADKVHNNPRLSHLEPQFRSLSGACDLIHDRANSDSKIRSHIMERQNEVVRAQAHMELFGGNGKGNSK